MGRETKKLLTDIMTAVERINSYVGEAPSFEAYQLNMMLQQAVERNIEIIGEAVNALMNNSSGIAITNARKIVNTRNRIIHGYADVDNTEVWAIIVNHLPLLKSEIGELLSTLK